ncbi:MAG: GspE/PulE family protein [Dehalococcoidales bacterium]|nr:GspE/PulE family protein [Dehalococcoidales bacterium]
MPEVSSNSSKSHSLRTYDIHPDAIQLVSEAMAREYNAIPLEVKGQVLRVAMANPDDVMAIEALAARTQMRIEPVEATAEAVREAIDSNYREQGELEKELSRIQVTSETTEEQALPTGIEAINDAPIVKALALIIDEAVKARASDIHLQPQEDGLWVRYRIDGTLQETHRLPLDTAVPLISRIKILASMNIADHHRPQDGQFSVVPKGRRDSMDIRVGIIPTVHGEMAALRLLDKSKALMTLLQIGFLQESLAEYQEMLKVPHGIIMVSGPTGSGKTTTLYATLNTLDSKGRNIITIEDPVEYRFRNINQIQVNSRAGLTFAAGLRSILRLDPNVILVGEMRDAETANIAIQSALTGHLVLSTIHANDSTGIVARLLDLGIERFLIASALIGVVAQRMIRRVCPDCAEMLKAPVAEQKAYEKETGEVREKFLYGKGCKSCAGTGYRGRQGIFEILRINDELRTMLLEGDSISQFRVHAIKLGMIPLSKDGMLKVKANITTPAEILRTAYTLD